MSDKEQTGALYSHSFSLGAKCIALPFCVAAMATWRKKKPLNGASTINRRGEFLSFLAMGGDGK